MVFNGLCGGFNQAITVLTSIAYGQDDMQMCEVILNRGRFIGVLAFLPFAGILALCGVVYSELGLEEDVLTSSI